MAAPERGSGALPPKERRSPENQQPDEAAGKKLSYVYRTRAGLLRLSKIGQLWAVEFNEVLCGHWRSPNEAAFAAAQHETGVPEWDRARIAVPDDLRRWTQASA